MIGYINESLFLYKTLNSKRGILQKNVFEVLHTENTASIKLGNLKFGGNWFLSSASYAVDIVSLCLICQIIKPNHIFEIGTLTGYTSFHFALNTPPDTRVYALDLPKDKSVEPILKTTITDDAHIKASGKSAEYCFEGTVVEAKIQLLFGDSGNFDFSPFYNMIDFFFIDGSHSYDYVRSDTLNAIKCCHPGSVIAWHDFGRVGVNGVTKWLRELSKEYEIFSVPGSSIAFMVIPD